MVKKGREGKGREGKGREGKERLHSTHLFTNHTGRILHEITLDESIRYNNGDLIESWLTNLLCLDASIVKPISSG